MSLFDEEVVPWNVLQEDDGCEDAPVAVLQEHLFEKGEDVHSVVSNLVSSQATIHAKSVHDGAHHDVVAALQAEGVGTDHIPGPGEVAGFVVVIGTAAVSASI